MPKYEVKRTEPYCFDITKTFVIGANSEDEADELAQMRMPNPLNPTRETDSEWNLQIKPQGDKWISFAS